MGRRLYLRLVVPPGAGSGIPKVALAENQWDSVERASVGTAETAAVGCMAGWILGMPLVKSESTSLDKAWEGN